MSRQLLLATAGWILLVVLGSSVLVEAVAPLVLDGDTVIELDGEDLVAVGEIELRDRARLVVRNADVVMSRSDPYEEMGFIRAWDSSRVELMNVSGAGAVEGLWISAFDSAVVVLDGMRGRASAEAYGESEVSVLNCSVQELRIGGGATLIAENVYVDWTVDFQVDGNSSIELSGLNRETEIEKRVLGPDQNLPFHLELSSSFVNGWSVHVNEGADVRLVDSVFERVVLLHGAPRGRLAGLRSRPYERWIYPDDLDITADFRLELLNTEVADHWVFCTQGNVDLEIADCQSIFFYFADGYSALDIADCEIRGFNMRRMMGDLQFENTRIVEEIGFEDCTWITMTGGLSFGGDARIERWENSMVQRTYPFRVVGLDGMPVAGQEIVATLPDGRDQSVISDDAGEAEVKLIVDDSSIAHTLRATVDPGDRPMERTISFLSDTPIVFDFNRASIDPATLHVGTVAALEEFHPARSPLRGRVFESLFTLDSRGRLVPLLAVSVPSTENGGITMHDDGACTIVLEPRANVIFHSGERMTPADVEYCLEEVLLNCDHPWRPDALGAIGVAGLALQVEEKGAAAVATTIDDAIHSDGELVFIELARPFSGIWAFLAQAPIAPRDWLMAGGLWNRTSDSITAYIEADPFAEFPKERGIGTGPYSVAQISEDGRDVVLTRHAAYWGDAPSIESVRIAFDRTPQQLIGLLQLEYLDIALGMPSRVPRDDCAEEEMLVEIQTLHPLVLEDQPNLMWGIFNQVVEPSVAIPSSPSGDFDSQSAPVDLFSDLDARLGFLHAFNWSTYIREARQRGWLVRPVGSPLSSLFRDRRDTDVEYEYSADTARAHLAAAWNGQLVESGFTTFACFNGGNDARRFFSDYLGASMTALNDRYTVDMYDPEFNTIAESLFADELPIAVLGLTEGYGALEIPYLLLHSAGIYPAGISGSQFDDLLERATRTLDLDVRDAALEELGAMVAADPIGFFWRNQRLVVVQEWVHGRSCDPYYAFGQVPDFDLRGITKDLP